MSEYTRKCVVCGTQYEYCVRCSRFAHLEPWHYSYHDATCKELFNICAKYAGGLISAVDAKKQIDKLKMPSHLAEHIRKNIEKINKEVGNTNAQLKSEPTLKETPEPTEVQSSPVTEEPKSEEVFTEVPEEPKSEETPVEQPSSVKGFRKRRLERQKQNEEN